MILQEIKWDQFFGMLPFMLFGFFVHALGKFSLARLKPGYSFATFLYRMGWSWVVGFCYALIGCYLSMRGIADYGMANALDVVGLLMGITAGSMAKTTVNLLTRKKGA